MPHTHFINRVAPRRFSKVHIIHAYTLYGSFTVKASSDIQMTVISVSMITRTTYNCPLVLNDKHMFYYVFQTKGNPGQTGKGKGPGKLGCYSGKRRG